MHLSAADLLCLARAYSDHSGIALTTAGVRACRNDKLFVRLAAGKTCTVRSLERAALWFADNWPADTPWPEGIPRPEVRERAA